MATFVAQYRFSHFQLLDALGRVMRRRKAGAFSPKLKYAAIVTTARNEADAH
jgi:hypothetical protein